MRYLLFLLSFTSLASASCLFRVANYSLSPIKVKVGFYHGESKQLRVGNSEINSVLIEGDNNCVSQSIDGSGIAYVDLIGGKSNGGWRYLPQSGMIRAVSKSVKSGGFVTGTDINGNDISLFNNFKTESGVFDVQIRPSQFRDSKSAGSSN
jgi:hypothetical protein